MEKHVAWIVLICLLLGAAAMFQSRLKHQMYDFEVYRVAGVRAAAGEALYRVEDGHWQFKYFPAFALAIAPIAQLPAMTARAVWLGLSVVLLVILVSLSTSLLPERRHSAFVIAGFASLALGKFFIREVGLGQSNVLLAVLVLSAVAAWRAKREGAAGAWLAAATIVKPYAVLFLPYLILRRPTRGAAAYLGVVAAALLLPVLRYGWSGNLTLLEGWFATVTQSTAPNLASQDNTSVAGMFAAWFGVGPLASWLALALTLVLLAACTRAFLKTRGVIHPEYLDAALLLFLIPLLSPQGWDYVLLVSAPAVMLLIDRFGEMTRPLQWLVVACMAIPAFTLWDVMGREAYRVFMMSRLVSLCALVEFALVLRLRDRRAA
ncbi:MAG: glycosyltransferase family 87 protein [Acidobacteria bacterium]|nr:glycosyltransferase family 87 protein [Acidobacteriota bacterium]